MAFNEKEQQIIKWGLENGKTVPEIKQAVRNFRETGSPRGLSDPRLQQRAQPAAAQSVTQTPASESLYSRIQSRITGAGEKVESAISGRGQYEGVNPVSRGLSAAAEAATGVTNTAFEVLPKPAREGLTKVGEVVGENVITPLVDKIASIPALQQFTQKHPEATDALVGVLTALKDAGVISSTILLADQTSKAAQTVAKAPGAALRTAKSVEAGIKDGIVRLKDRAAQTIVEPPKDTMGVAREVLQPKGSLREADVAALARSGEGATTYRELVSRAQKGVEDFSSRVDDVLAKDTKVYKPADFIVKATSSKGSTVSVDYATRVLDQLEELYKKTGDDLGAADISEVRNLLNTKGLTRGQLNDIARIYSSEFGAKGFSRVDGTPLTSTNSELYKTTQAGIKQAVQMSDDIGREAAALDDALSGFLRVKKLAGKMSSRVEAVKQTMADSSLASKVTSQAVQVLDTLSNRTISYFLRGASKAAPGEKVLSTLQLEERLVKNLARLAEEVKSAPSEKAMLTAVKKLQSINDNIGKMVVSGELPRTPIAQATAKTVGMEAVFRDAGMDAYVKGSSVLKREFAQHMIDDVAGDMAEAAAETFRTAANLQLEAGLTAKEILNIAKNSMGI